MIWMESREREEGRGERGEGRGERGEGRGQKTEGRGERAKRCGGERICERDTNYIAV